uniref:Uncharacterized protein n=1 Tax=Hyaloperonospora arabidopsidis (strain Emoy2) TaxID=559515 RepID=M4BCZ4_HYAAE
MRMSSSGLPSAVHLIATNAGSPADAASLASLMAWREMAAFASQAASPSYAYVRAETKFWSTPLRSRGCSTSASAAKSKMAPMPAASSLRITGRISFTSWPAQKWPKNVVRSSALVNVAPGNVYESSRSSPLCCTSGRNCDRKYTPYARTSSVVLLVAKMRFVSWNSVASDVLERVASRGEEGDGAVMEGRAADRRGDADAEKEVTEAWGRWRGPWKAEAVDSRETSSLPGFIGSFLSRCCCYMLRQATRRSCDGSAASSSSTCKERTATIAAFSFSNSLHL